MSTEEIKKIAEERQKELVIRAMQTTDCTDFRNWTSKDRTTAFFEVFGKYIKNPNKDDFKIVYRIWLWAVHADKALAETIRYTLKWNNMTIAQEYKKWRK